jgi:hypothetical protein
MNTTPLLHLVGSLPYKCIPSHARNRNWGRGGGVFITLDPYLGEPRFQISKQTPTILALGVFLALSSKCRRNRSEQVTTASIHAFTKLNLLTTLRYDTKRMETPSNKPTMR